ncbi:MAG: hypothetical protein ACKOXJ_01660 [Alphaproteobacteria bacterium]
MIKDQFNLYKNSWINSSKIGFSVDENFNAIPWYSFEAIEFLKTHLKPEHRVFEFGSGSSTIFFNNHCSKVVAIETNNSWFEIICEKIHGNVDSDNNHFISKNSEIFLLENAIDNVEYENFANNYSKKNNFKFDFIAIDSLKRHLCTLNSIESIKKGGFLILDDSERPNYQKTIDFLEQNNFEHIVFSGIAPAQLKIKNTSFFLKK